MATPRDTKEHTKNATKWQHIINPMASPWDKKVAAYHQPNGIALGIKRKTNNKS